MQLLTARFTCAQPSFCRWAARQSVWMLRIAMSMGVAAILGCGDRLVDSQCYDPCSPDAYGMISGIGPAGGTIEYRDPDHPMDGLKVRVPAGAWDACWEVWVRKRGILNTPDYPRGFVPFERPAATGSVEIVIYRSNDDGTETYPPDSMYLEILFPLHSIVAGDSEVLSAFCYDRTAESWEIRLPDALDNEVLTVTTSDWRQKWSWGRIDLNRIDYDRYVAPVMEEHYGTYSWNQIEATLDSLKYTLGPLSLNCVSLVVARNFFEAAQHESYEVIQHIQGTIRCGDCDATTPEFYRELRQYLDLNVKAYITELLIDYQRNKLIKLWGMTCMLIIQYQLLSIQCDYLCFLDELTLPFYLSMATHYTSYMAVTLIDLYIEAGFINCPLH